MNRTTVEGQLWYASEIIFCACNLHIFSSITSKYVENYAKYSTFDTFFPYV